jgi:hypothetical protein
MISRWVLEWADKSKHLRTHGSKLLTGLAEATLIHPTGTGSASVLTCRVGLICDTTDQKIGFTQMR